MLADGKSRTIDMCCNCDLTTHLLTRYPKELDSFQHSELQNRDDYKGKSFVVVVNRYISCV